MTYAKPGIPVLKLDQAVRNFQLSKFLINDITVYLVYRPPSAPADSITELTELEKAAEKNSVFIGDFNLPDMDWEGGVARGRTAGLMEAIEDGFMEQLVDFPTQVKGNILDLIVTNIPERFEDVSEHGQLGKSDHFMIVAKISRGAARQEENGAPDWRRADWDGEKVTGLVGQHVPERRRRNQNRPAWLSQEIMRAIRRKKRLWRTCRDRIPTDEYKEAEKKVRNLIRNAKRRFEKKLASGNPEVRSAHSSRYSRKDEEQALGGPPESGGWPDGGGQRGDCKPAEQSLQGGLSLPERTQPAHQRWRT